MAKKENRYIPQVVFHPGETLSEKLAEMKMGSKEFAVRTDKPEKTINAVLKGESSITPDMAVQFESVTKIPAHFWMNKQPFMMNLQLNGRYRSRKKTKLYHKEYLHQRMFGSMLKSLTPIRPLLSEGCNTRNISLIL